MRRQVRERERPEPSVVWQTLAITFAGFSFAAALGALTIAENGAVSSGELWIGAAGFLLAAVLCFAAHLDVNRGRRSKWVEVEELPSGQQKDPPARV
ncbi:MAG TPA: hypothetical protein VFZ29_06005 [Solirubrobacterales bacterium]